MHPGNDRTAKWLIDRHGDSVLRLAGITGFTRWHALPPEAVAPRRLPDGLIEVWFPGRTHPDLVLVEIETYPDKDVDRQVFEDLEAVHRTRGVTPEVVCLALKPKGHLVVTGTATRAGRRGSTTVTATWPVVNLWEVDAEELLGQGDPGLIPWVPLAKSTKPRADVLIECRDRLNAVSDPRPGGFDGRHRDPGGARARPDGPVKPVRRSDRDDRIPCPRRTDRNCPPAGTSRHPRHGASRGDCLEPGSAIRIRPRERPGGPCRGE